MAKKDAATPSPVVLVTSKEAFKAQLSDRIALGQDLYDKPISYLEDLEETEREYETWNDYNSEFLKQSFSPESNEYKQAYDDANRLSFISIGPTTSQERLREYKDSVRRKLDNLRSLLNRADLLKVSNELSSTNRPKQPSSTMAINDNKQVFIVHGHNRLILEQVARALERLELEPIILSEQPNAGRTIIEKFEQSSEVGFAVVLLTADDEGKAKRETEYRDRARQNVILELGYFIGKLGRSRVCALFSDGVEPPSDIHGLVYVLIDQNGQWKFQLVKELKNAGYDVDANAII